MRPPTGRVPFSLRGVLPVVLLVVGLFSLSARCSDENEGGALASGSSAGARWIQVIEEHVPPLKHDRGGRLPMVLWESGGHDPLPESVVRMLLARGLARTVRLSATDIPAALALQRAGSPVIVLDARGGVWPYKAKGNNTEPFSPGDLAPWARAADGFRATLRAFREAGVEVDGFWLDFEGQPSMASFDAVSQSPAHRELLPAGALASREAFMDFRRQFWAQLMSSYVAAPIREFYPRASITNWVITLSSRERPVRDWYDHPHPPLGPTLFTATTPVAYAIDTAFLASWRPETPRDQEHVDRFFMNVLLRQVSDNGWNLQRQAPYLRVIPWIGRWVPDHPKQEVPIMSREAYREGLRHLWLRGVDAMQVFNPVHAGRWEMAIAEVTDATSVYDEMLAHRKFLEKGEVLNFSYPEPEAPSLLWSGLRLGDRAVVRLYDQSGAAGRHTLELWPHDKVTLETPRGEGITHLVTRSQPPASIATPPRPPPVPSP
ncbi:MAG: hypothetical protein HQL66_03985 [Magnetococcales bacterium]|nr:hypothetical protein [Magnetococcales bacterium]